MMKFLLVAIFVAVVSAQNCEDGGPLSKADCNACIAADAGLTKDTVCEVCRNSASTSKACEDSADVVCNSLAQCYKDAEKNKAAKDAADMAAKYGKYCPTDKAKCSDKDSYCPTWAKAKPTQCTENPDWMLQNCQNSCCPICTGENTLSIGTCPEADREDLCVKNTHKSCHDWATTNPSECDENPKWMKPNCMQSCCDVCKKDKDGCPTVKDTCKNDYATPDAKEGSAKCEEWAKAGECTANPVWMKKNCGKECCTICKPVAPAKAAATTVVRQPVVYQQPVYQQPVYQQPRQVIQQVAQPRQVIQQVAQVAQPRQVVQQAAPLFGGYQAGLPYFG